MKLDRKIENIKDLKLVQANKTILFLSGKLSWAKVLGDPVLYYTKDARQWTFEIEPNEKGLQALIKNGLTDRIKGQGYNTGTKNQHKDRPPFIQLKKSEFSKDGSPNNPIRIYDQEDQDWDKDKLIGNGSLADVKVDIRDYGVGKIKGIYPVAIRVTDHVPYESSEFGGMDEDENEGASKKAAPKVNIQKDFELDDEIPL